MSEIILNLGNCLPALKKMPNKSVDLAICDPPYGYIGLKPNRVNFRMYEKGNYYINESPSQEYFSELFRVSKNQIIWGGNYFTDKLPISRSWLCWDKGEQMKVFSDFELAWTSFNLASKFVRIACNRIHTDIKETGKKIHQNQKPIALYKWLLQEFAEPGFKILDTHLGGGSIAIACYQMGFDLIAYEIIPETYNNAVARFERFKKRPKGFLEENTIFKIK
jgi:site-specific DNA-methyltransferase (adenine-specific)